MRLSFSLFVALASVGGAIACGAAKEDTQAAVAGSDHTPPTPGTTQDGAGRPRDNVKWSTAAVQPVSPVRLRPDIAPAGAASSHGVGSPQGAAQERANDPVFQASITKVLGLVMEGTHRFELVSLGSSLPLGNGVLGASDFAEQQFYQPWLSSIDWPGRRFFFLTSTATLDSNVLRVLSTDDGSLKATLDAPLMVNLRYDPVSDRVYGLETVAGVTRLMGVNTTTGETIELASMHSLGFAMGVVAVDPGRAYIVGESRENGDTFLRRIDLVTSEMREVATVPLGNIRMDSEPNKLIATTSTSVVRIDLDSGVAETLVVLDRISQGQSAFDPATGHFYLQQVPVDQDPLLTVVDTRAKVVLGSIAVRANIAMEIRGNAVPL